MTVGILATGILIGIVIGVAIYWSVDEFFSLGNKKVAALRRESRIQQRHIRELRRDLDEAKMKIKVRSGEEE